MAGEIKKLIHAPSLAAVRYPWREQHGHRNEVIYQREGLAIANDGVASLVVPGGIESARVFRADQPK